ncbi:hypothetical protein OAC31_01270 [Polaribacter sp.]|nr:hypothetical protein [Polaribacter sp.]
MAVFAPPVTKVSTSKVVPLTIASTSLAVSAASSSSSSDCVHSEIAF